MESRVALIALRKFEINELSAMVGLIP